MLNNIILDAKYPYKVASYQIANKRIIQHDQLAFVPGIQGQYTIKNLLIYCITKTVSFYET